MSGPFQDWEAHRVHRVHLVISVCLCRSGAYMGDVPVVKLLSALPVVPLGADPVLGIRVPVLPEGGVRLCNLPAELGVGQSGMFLGKPRPPIVVYGNLAVTFHSLL